MAKVILSMHHKTLPGNLHYKNPNLGIPALQDGRLQVVDLNTPWDGGTVGINSFGFGGANVHAILKPCSKAASKQTDTSLRLLTVAGRSIDSVRKALKVAASNPDDIALHSMMAALNGPGKQFYCRGFALLNAEKDISDVKVRKPISNIGLRIS